MNKTVKLGSSEINLLLLFVIVCAIILFLLILAFAVLRSYRKREILSRFSPTHSAVVRLLRLTFGRKNVMTDVHIPVFTEDGLDHFVFADTVVIAKRCVYLVHIRTEAGLIYCEDGFDWHQSARLRSGGTLETDFSSPVDQSERALAALRMLMRRKDVEEPTVRGLVVFAPKSVRFSCTLPNVFKLEDAYRVMKRGAGGVRIRDIDADIIRKLILTNTVRKSSAENFNVKKGY